MSQILDLPTRMTKEEWCRLVEVGAFQDLSAELPDSFLLYGQWMRAKIGFKGKVYMASGWNFGGKPVVELVEVL
jgi:hypothetical protein